MKFDTSIPAEAINAKNRLNYLINRGYLVEITMKRHKRTLDQNSYLHVILTAWGGHLGYTLAEIKQLVKERLCPDIFAYEKNRKTFYRSTADLDTLEATTVIDKIRVTAKETGFTIASPEDHALIRQLQNENELLEQYQSQDA